MPISYHFRGFLALIPFCFLISGCVSQPFGILYTDSVKTEIVGNGYPMHRTETCATSIFGLVAIGDAGVYAAMKNGNLGRAALVETHISGALGIYKYCTVVYGPYGDIGPPPQGGEGKK